MGFVCGSAVWDLDCMWLLVCVLCKLWPCRIGDSSVATGGGELLSAA